MIKDIDKTPKLPYFNSHHFCDYIELLALINNEDSISMSDTYYRFYNDGRIKSPINDDDDNLGSFIPDINDKWDSRIREWFEILNVRKIVFKEFYPFNIINETTIKLITNLTLNHKLYIFLLLSSNLSYLKNKNLLSSDFEELSLQALKEYLPNRALSYRFGKSMLDYDRYKGHITKKIDLLANDLKYKTKYEKDDFADNDTGDGGLDIVSWVPFENDENQDNMSVYLCQCTTETDWYKKQDDIDKYEDNYVEFKTKINPTMFIPYDNRNVNRTFNDKKKIKKSLIFDRIRLLYLLKNNKSIISELSSFESIVDKVIEYEEDIV